MRAPAERVPRSGRRLLALVVVFGCAAAACGGGTGSSGGDGSTADSAAVELPTECQVAPFDVELRVTGSGAEESFSVVDAVAVRKLDGRAYTVYLTDYAIDRSEDLIGQVSVPPAGSTTVQTGLDIFNADDPMALPIIEAGDVGEVKWDAGDLATFLAVLIDGEDTGAAVDAGGSATVLAVDDEILCVRAEMHSERGSELVGVYRAEIVEDL